MFKLLAHFLFFPPMETAHNAVVIILECLLFILFLFSSIVLYFRFLFQHQVLLWIPSPKICGHVSSEFGTAVTPDTCLLDLSALHAGNHFMGKHLRKTGP